MKQLQKEVARLEAELRTPDASDKDLKIHQVNFFSATLGILRTSIWGFDILT